MSRPLVSVLLPVHNGERFLRPALDSVLTQTLRCHEVIVVDDGSTDGTAEILTEYQSSDDRITVCHQVANGIPASLNVALGLASGEYVARMDADDIAVPDRFERQVGFLQAHPEVAVLGGTAVVIDSEGRQIGSMRFPTDNRQIRRALVETNPFCHPATMLRRSILHAVGGYRRAFTLAQDYDLWLRISENSEMANLREPVLYYRFHADQVSTRQLRQQVLEAIAARASTRLRRTQQTDPFDSDEVVTMDLLRGVGVSDHSVQSQILSEVAIRAMVLASIGQNREARAIMHEAMEGTPLSSTARRVQAQIGVAYARAHFSGGSLAEGLMWLLMACVAHPMYVCQSVWRGARDIGLPRVAALVSRRVWS